MDPQLQSVVDWCTKTSTAITTLDSQVSELTDANTSLTQAVQDKDAALTAATAQVDALNTQVQTLSQQEADAQSQVQALTSQHDTDTQTITQLNVQVQDLQKKLAAAPAPVDLSGVLLDVLSERRMTILAGLHKLPADTTSSKEQLGVWIDSGGHTAQSNPDTNTTPHGTFTWTPGTDTTPARIFFTPAAGWDNIFEYERFVLPSKLPSYLVDIRTFSLTAADRAVVNCIEWQNEFTWGGKVFNMAWQWNFPKKLFRYFDFTSRAWVASPVPWLDLGTTPVTLMAEYILDEANGKTTHLAMTVNGQRNLLNITQAATPKPGAANKYTVSINQLDSDSKGDPFGVNIHNCEVRYII